jgi:hypothetical protein
MKITILVALSICLLAGCGTTRKAMTATGGSKADGIVKMSYEIGMFERVQVDMETSKRDAASRCAVWGYTGAEPFGGQVKQCTSRGTYDCNQWLVTMEFQCTGERAKQ